MQVQRVPCRNVGCKNLILPATAKINDGYCAPCVQRRGQEEREEFIGKNRREVDPYQGILDPVEIIRVLHTPRPHDPLIILHPPPKSIEILYSELSGDQADRLMMFVAEALRDGNEDFAEDVARSLATLTEHSLDRMLEAWIAQNHYWPSVIFRGAGEAIRDAVISAVESESANVNQALSALAWVGDGAVADLFRRWEVSPPDWRGDLFVGPAGYANVAGWELSPGGRRDLFHQECWAVTPAPSDAKPDGALRIFREVGQICPWCKRQLMHLIELNLADERFAFLGFSGEKFSVLTCDACTCYGTGYMFSHAYPDGTAKLMIENVCPGWLPDWIDSWQRSPWKDVTLRLHPRHAMRSADWFVPVPFTQIGGLPTWIQDTAFPKCPTCSDSMKFIAQVDNGQFPYHEGIYYAFLCANCRVTATTYQQS